MGRTSVDVALRIAILSGFGWESRSGICFRGLNSFLALGCQSPRFLLGWHYGRLYFLVSDTFCFSFEAFDWRDFLNSGLESSIASYLLSLSSDLSKEFSFFRDGFLQPLMVDAIISATRDMSEK